MLNAQDARPIREHVLDVLANSQQTLREIAKQLPYLRKRAVSDALKELILLGGVVQREAGRKNGLPVHEYRKSP